MLLLLSTLSTASAGWTVTPETGTASTEALKSLSTLVDACPASQGDWIARYAGGELVRLGPVAGPDPKDAMLESCLRAGLASRPVPGDVILRATWVDPTAEIWEAQTSGILEQVIGPQPKGGCSTLRFPIGADGALGAPTLSITSGDDARDAHVLQTVNAYPDPLPPVPGKLREIYGPHVDLCVGGPS
jgi:hypothetical protein